MKMGCLPASGNVSLIRTRFVCVCAEGPGPGHIFGVVAVKKNISFEFPIIENPCQPKLQQAGQWHHICWAGNLVQGGFYLLFAKWSSPSQAGWIRKWSQTKYFKIFIVYIQNHGRCQTHQEAMAIFGIWQDCKKAEGAQSPLLPDPRLLQHESMCGSCGPWALYSFPWSKSMVVQSMSGGLLI